jgi:hypothetical protein
MVSEHLAELLDRAEHWRRVEQLTTDQHVSKLIQLEIANLEQEIARLSPDALWRK